jgi:hypothetical protein
MIRSSNLFGTVGVCAVLLSGCRGSSGATVSRAGATTPPSASAAEAEAANGDCTSRRSEEDLRVTIYGGGEAACVKWDEHAAQEAEQYWKPTNEEPNQSPVCSMGKGLLVIEVRTRELASIANRICARLLAKGWHEVEGPGEKDEREQRETEVHQREQQARREAAANAKAEAAETARREREEHHEEAEEAALKREEAHLRAQEAREREVEQAAQRHEEAEQREELRRENELAEEETRRAEQEAARGE